MLHALPGTRRADTHTSCVTRHTSCVIRIRHTHTSHVMRRASCVMRHASCVTCHFSGSHACVEGCEALWMEQVWCMRPGVHCTRPVPPLLCHSPEAEAMHTRTERHSKALGPGIRADRRPEAHSLTRAALVGFRGLERSRGASVHHPDVPHLCLHQSSPLHGSIPPRLTPNGPLVAMLPVRHPRGPNTPADTPLYPLPTYSTPATLIKDPRSRHATCVMQVSMPCTVWVSIDFSRPRPPPRYAATLPHPCHETLQPLNTLKTLKTP